MPTLLSPEAIAAYIGAVATGAVAAVAYAQNRSTGRVARDQDQRQANLTTLRTATVSCSSFQTFMRSELRDLAYYVDRARDGEPMPSSRVALSARLESSYGERMRTLPTGFLRLQDTYEGVLGHVRRVDEALDDYAASRGLPSGSALADRLYSLRTQVDLIDALVELASFEFSSTAPLPSGWGTSFSVPPEGRRGRRRSGG